MAQGERPLSPHLEIYKPQLTMVLSITHRFTGVGLAVGTLFLTWWLIAAAMGPEAYGFTQWIYGTWLGTLVLFGFSVSLCYHLCNGIRHLFWDVGMGYEIETVYRSGWSVLAATAVLTFAAWVIGLGVAG